MSKLIALTRYSDWNQGAAGKVLVRPEAVAAIIEVLPARGLQSRCRIKLLDGEMIEIYEDPDIVRARLGL